MTKCWRHLSLARVLPGLGRVILLLLALHIPGMGCRVLATVTPRQVTAHGDSRVSFPYRTNVNNAGKLMAQDQ